MAKMTESALELVRKKKHPDHVQEKEEEEVCEFVDFELPEKHRDITEIIHKIWSACSEKVLNALVVVVFILVLGTWILKWQVLGVIALIIAVIMMTISMVMIVRAPATQNV